jgi:DNA-directed RNA polymerase subunit RPC12/RpoP
MTLFNYKCKDCGKEVEVEKYCTYFKCDECEEKQRQKRLQEKSTNICTNCGKEFKKDPSSRAYHCSECKDKVQFNKTHTACSRCKQILHRDKFPAGNTTVCFDCKREENEEIEKIKLSQKVYTRHCKTCGKDVETINRFATVINCKECEDKKQELKNEVKVFIRKCLECSKDIETAGHATVLYCKECKQKKEDNKRLKKLSYFDRKHYRTCQYCGTKEEVERDLKKRHYTCSNCLKDPKYLIDYTRHCKICGKDIIVKDPYATFMSCEDCNSKKDELKIYVKSDNCSYRKCSKCHNEFKVSAKSRRYICLDCKPKKNKKVVEFNKKKHYGYYGISSDGHKWWSLNEQDLEEWLISKNIRHIPQKRIGESLKHADQYLPDFDLHIEMDGLRRKDDIDWCGKLSLYKRLNLKYKIVEPIKVHFNDDPEKCFIELNEKLSFIMEKV